MCHDSHFSSYFYTCNLKCLIYGKMTYSICISQCVHSSRALSVIARARALRLAQRRRKLLACTRNLNITIITGDDRSEFEHDHKDVHEHNVGGTGTGERTSAVRLRALIRGMPRRRLPGQRRRTVEPDHGDSSMNPDGASSLKSLFIILFPRRITTLAAPSSPRVLLVAGTRTRPGCPWLY